MIELLLVEFVGLAGLTGSLGPVGPVGVFPGAEGQVTGTGATYFSAGH